MTSARKIAYRFRTVLLVVWVLLLLAGVVWLFLPIMELEEVSLGLAVSPAVALFGSLLEYFRHWSEEVALSVVNILYVALFLATEWMLLSSRKYWPIKTTPNGRSVWKAIIAGAFASALLSVGLIYTLLDLIEKNWLNWFYDDFTAAISLLIPLSLWLFWGTFFFGYYKKRDFHTFIGKLLRGLFVGSILQMLVATPIFASSKQECYCARGSYAGIVFGITIMLWAFGPGVIFFYLKEKQRLEQKNS